MNKETTRDKTKITGFGFSINSCPLHLYKSFTKGIKERHNDCYWSRLNELLIKEECYDRFIKYGLIPVEDSYDEDDLVDQLVKEDEQEEESIVKTMGDRIRVN